MLRQHCSVCKLTDCSKSCDTATGIALNLSVVCTQLHNERFESASLHDGRLVPSYREIHHNFVGVNVCVCVCVWCTWSMQR